MVSFLVSLSSAAVESYRELEKVKQTFPRGLMAIRGIFFVYTIDTASRPILRIQNAPPRSRSLHVNLALPGRGADDAESAAAAADCRDEAAVGDAAAMLAAGFHAPELGRAAAAAAAAAAADAFMPELDRRRRKTEEMH